MPEMIQLDTNHPLHCEDDHIGCALLVSKEVQAGNQIFTRISLKASTEKTRQDRKLTCSNVELLTHTSFLALVGSHALV